MIARITLIALTVGLGLAACGKKPTESFLKSCKNVTHASGTITADCLDAQGAVHSSSISEQCTTDLANINGVLTCAVPK